MSTSVLLCTVGGSHQPILKAIRATSPDHVCFFCTGRDPETGKPGSDRQVTGKDSVIKARWDDTSPTLPNIPTQAGLEEDRFEVREVPADDLDQAFLDVRNAIVELTERFPSARYVADYTGGTKTMTAALVIAALESDLVELQLVTGARSNLHRVEDGVEQAMTASVDRLRLDRAMAPYLGAWRRFAYREAAEGLDGIRIVANAPDKPRLALARALSRALARWDDFDHAGALEAIGAYDGRVARYYRWMLPTLRLLADEDDPKNEPARLFDLWLNAERRAAQGRFDDAVARVYRLIEWTAQWQIRTSLGEDTASLPVAVVPAALQPAMSPRVDHNGRVKIGLLEAWQIVKEHKRLAGPMQEFIRRHEAGLKDWLLKRNGSILAHGFRPVQAEDWERVRSWTIERFLPALRTAASEVRLKRMPEQLPTEPPE